MLRVKAHNFEVVAVVWPWAGSAKDNEESLVSSGTSCCSSLAPWLKADVSIVKWCWPLRRSPTRADRMTHIGTSVFSHPKTRWHTIAPWIRWILRADSTGNWPYVDQFDFKRNAVHFLKSTHKIG